MSSNESSPNTLATEIGSQTSKTASATVSTYDVQGISKKEMKKEKKLAKKQKKLAANESMDASGQKIRRGRRSRSIDEMLSMDDRNLGVHRATSRLFESLETDCREFSDSTFSRSYEVEEVKKPKSALRHVNKYTGTMAGKKQKSSVMFVEEDIVMPTSEASFECDPSDFEDEFEDEETGLGDDDEDSDSDDKITKFSGMKVGKKRKKEKKDRLSPSFVANFVRNHNSGRRSSTNTTFESLRNMSTSTRFISLTQRGEVETYPADCYSFMAIHSPVKHPFYFFFGFTVFGFQVLFLFFMVMSQVAPEFTTKGEIDNPSDSWLASFIPANVTTLVRATQVTALLSYCLFADSSLKDCIMAVEHFPRIGRATKEDRAYLQGLACLFRFIQGLLAVVATLLLIITADDVIDIILNFAAVNYISTLDESAFELAKEGKYGPSLEHEAKNIEKKPIPYCIYRKYQHVRYIATVVPIMVILLGLLGVIIYGQQNKHIWVTQTMRVQFQGATSLQEYSGCYLVSNATNHKRRSYHGFSKNPEPGIIGYCKEDRRWVLYKEGDGDEDESNEDAACDIARERQLAYSAPTDAFDVSTSFDEAWYSASGTPLDLYFFESNNNGEDLVSDCESYLSNGVCDVFFNTLGYQYDGGDCCASTCAASNCGVGGITKAFGLDGKNGNGYPNCKDPGLESLTIHINRISSSRDQSILTVSDVQLDDYARERGEDFWEETPVTPLFMVDCGEEYETNLLSMYVDDSMSDHSEVIMVEDGDWCRITVTNTTSTLQSWDNDPIWWINYTVYHGNNTKNAIITGYSGNEESVTFQRIPQCFFATLADYTDVETAYSASDPTAKAISWLANDPSGYSSCVDEFLVERYALSAVNFAAPIISDPNTREESQLWIMNQQQCRWENTACNEGSVEALTVRSLNLDGTIAPTVGLLTSLRKMVYDGNDLRGTIPTEIGLLTQLTGLDIDNNKLTGTIPTELGKLKKMVELDLDANNLSGPIPTEFGRLINAREFDLIHNQLSGPIPTEIGNLASLATFAAEGNNLSGTIPSQVGKMENIAGLNLAHNSITGTIPPEIRFAKSSLTELVLNNNAMEGTIPTEIGRLTLLTQLVLDANRFTGTLPSQVGTMTSLTLLSVRGNYLEGKLPTELGLLTNLTELRIEGNLFTGPIPIELTLLQRLRVMTFEDGFLTGSIPPHIKTQAPCILCDGDNYDLKAERNIEEDVIFAENGEHGVVKHSCRSLLKLKWAKEELFSAKACSTLQDTCVNCGTGGYYDSDDSITLQRAVIDDVDDDDNDIFDMEALLTTASTAYPRNIFVKDSASHPCAVDFEYDYDHDVTAATAADSENVFVHDLSVR